MREKYVLSPITSNMTSVPVQNPLPYDAHPAPETVWLTGRAAG